MIKPHLLKSRFLITALASLPLCLSAVGQEGAGFYFHGSLGSALARNVDVKEFLGPGAGAKVTLDPGVSLNLAAGYNFNTWLGVEMETGVLANNIDRIGASSVDASLSHVPFLANVVLRYDTERSPIVPYIGFGVGADSSVLIVDDSLGVDGSDSDVVFAFQAMAGVRYKINDRMSAGAGYKFFHAGSPTWHVHGSGGGDIRFGNSMVHAIVGVFNWKF